MDIRQLIILLDIFHKFWQDKYYINEWQFSKLDFSIIWAPYYISQEHVYVSYIIRSRTLHRALYLKIFMKSHTLYTQLELEVQKPFIVSENYNFHFWQF